MLPVALTLNVVGCVAMKTLNDSLTPNAAMASWQGRNWNDLVASWGPPARVMDDGSGGRILTYEIKCSNPGVRLLRMFWANRDNVIYRWSWHGAQCPFYVPPRPTAANERSSSSRASCEDECQLEFQECERRYAYTTVERNIYGFTLNCSNEHIECKRRCDQK